MEGKYYIGLESYHDCIEIEATIKDCFIFKVPSWDMDVAKQDLINIRDKINKVLEDE